MKRVLTHNRETLHNDTGFTLVELMVTLVVSTFIAATIMIAYTGQHRTQIAQDEVIGLQQNLRAAMSIVSSDIRMATYKPPSSTNDTEITTAQANNIVYSWEDDANQFKTYRFRLNNNNLERIITDTAGNVETDVLAQHIMAFELLYALEDTTNNNNYDPVKTTTPTAGEIKDIRAVTLSILARSENPSKDGIQGPSLFATASGATVAVDSSYRHRMLSTTVKLRNMGL